MSDSPFSKAIVAIMLNSPFFSSVVMKRKLVEDSSIQTAGIWRNGEIHYNPTWVEGLTERHKIFLLCHECLHYLGRDLARRGDRGLNLWNIACDEVINKMLVDAGIGDFIPDGMQPMEGTKEQRYSALLDQCRSSISSVQDHNYPLGGDLTDRGADVPEAEVAVELAQAALAQACAGNVPAGLGMFVEAVLHPSIPYTQLLAQWLVSARESRPSWQRRNRRYQDIYMPGMSGMPAHNGAEHVLFAVDTSASTRDVLPHLVGSVLDIMAQVDIENVTLLSVDTEVYPLEDIRQLKGGGGTDLRALNAYTTEHSIHPTLGVWLTDGETPWPTHVDYPLVVLSTNQPAPVSLAPTIRINDEN